MGDEAVTGLNDWIENRLKELDQIFAVFVSGFSLMDNHLHLLLRIDPEVANGWSDSEVVERWFRLFPPCGSDRKRMKVSNMESLCLSFYVHRRCATPSGLVRRFWGATRGALRDPGLCCWTASQSPKQFPPNPDGV
jgi:hypothetical protein